jgi:hypothetical protein
MIEVIMPLLIVCEKYMPKGRLWKLWLKQTGKCIIKKGG